MKTAMIHGRPAIITALALITLCTHLTSNNNADPRGSSINVSTAATNKRESMGVQNKRRPTKNKTILLWNGYNRVELRSLQFRQPIPDETQCPVRNCTVTTDRSSMSIGDFDAVIFNMAVLDVKSDPLPSWRREHQRYVYMSQESPFYTGADLKRYAGFFNWTMSFQAHSDIAYRYGRVERKPDRADNVTSVRATGGKTKKMVAWFVSHCRTQSQREKYVAELKKWIQVDVYGLCGRLKCSWNESAGTSTTECYEMLESDYKFYLAFENSMCKEYVTEKLYATLNYRIVPIVAGLADYQLITPPHSVIDAGQYSAKELAEYLIYLNENDDKYNEYFNWKSHYVVHSGYEQMGHEALCSLCTKLHHDHETNTYRDLRLKWNHRTQCVSPRFSKLFKHLPSQQRYRITHH